MNAPDVSLDLGDNAGNLVTAPIDVRGSILDDGSLDYYRLLVAPVAGGDFREIAFVDNPNAVTDGVLGKFDPSLWQNDSYILRLEVADNGGHISYSEEVVDVAGELKLGNFRLSLIYEYDARGNILTEIDAEGQITKRKYDDENNVLEETVISDRSGSNGFTTKYTYDSQNNKLTETDPVGNITRYTYGDKSRLLTETDALGRTSTNVYSNSGNLRSTTDATGKVTNYSYDLRGQLRSVTDANGNVTAFDYDDSGNVTRVTDALGNVTAYTYNANGDKLTESRQMTISNGQVRELLTTWTYDAMGRMKTMTDAENHTTIYEYDKLGHQSAVIDALQHRTEYKYDDRGQLVATIYADNTPDNPDDNLRETSRYDEAGRTIATIDKAGRETRFVYDKVGRLRYTISPDSTPDNPNISPELWDNPKTETVYYDDGLVKAQIDELGNRTEFRYDADGRQTEIIYADDTPNTLDDNSRTTYKYDKVGQRITETDALNHTTTFNYDDLGRLSKTEFNDKTYTTTEYDNLGRRIATIDKSSKRTEYSYDALGRLTGVKNALQDWTEYGYNQVGNLIWMEDANDHRTKYEYDGVGRRTATILPLEQRSDSVYDAVGNLKTYTDFNRNTTTYSYDPMNWMTSKQFQDGSKVTYAYTTVGLQDVIKFVDTSGQITATYDYDYDVQDRQIQRTDNIGGVIRSINYTYDVAGNRSSVTTASGTVNYTFDVRNRLDKVIENSVVTADYDYDAVSNLVRTTFANGTQEIRSYDDLNRLKYLENHQGDTILSSYTYTLDKVGNRTKVVEHDGRSVDYTYDDLYRLTQEKITDAINGNRVYDYIYDKVGNRKTKSEIVNGATRVTNYAYDANDRLLDETVNQLLVGLYTYDNNGNTLTKTENGITTEYGWDFENRLIAARVKDAGGAVQQQMQYRYNDRGIRVASTVDGVETRYLIDELQPYAQVLEEYSPNGAVQVVYVYGHDLIAQEKGNSRTFYHVDGLGSTRVLTDASGSIVSTYDYEAYGELIGSTGGVENKYLFAGEQFDEALGDYYNRARYYDADTGRFTRRDTYEGNKKEPLTLHKYIYANHNPVRFIDPSGLATQDQGNEIAAYIQLYFWTPDPLMRAAEHKITKIWENIDVNRNSIPFSVVSATARGKIPDMVDYRNKEIYEIGTVKAYDEKRDKMDNVYLPAINNALSHLGRAADWTGGETFISPSPLVLSTGELVLVLPPIEGVISYQILFDGYYVATVAALFTAQAVAKYLAAEIAATASLTKGFI